MRGVRGGVVPLVVLVVVVCLPLAVRLALRAPDVGPAIDLVFPNGETTIVSLATMRRLPHVERRGEVQNQYGNWRDAGVYTGIPVSDLVRGADYAQITVIAADGYAVAIDRARIDDAAFPVVLAFALDGVAVPEWKDGFRLVVLPESGRVGNQEYGAVSAGSYWVKNVVRLVLEQARPLP